MSEESTYQRREYVPDARDEILEAARRGLITPQQAEARAQAEGVAPLTQVPSPSEVDPQEKAHWNLTMTFAWIVWRNYREVRSWDNDYIAKCIEWRASSVSVPRNGGASAETMNGHILDTPDLVFAWNFLLHGHHMRSGKSPVEDEWTIQLAAKPLLWQKLESGELTGVALRAIQPEIPSGARGADLLTRVPIPAHEWIDLQIGERPHPWGDALHFEHKIGVQYVDVRFKRADVEKLWRLKDGPLARKPSGPPRQPTPADEAALTNWAADFKERNSYPPIRTDAEAWAMRHGISVEAVRKLFAGLPAGLKNQPGKYPRNTRP